MTEKNSRKNETVDALFDAILSLESREECYAFFEDLCTVSELQEMSRRMQAARILRDAAVKAGAPEHCIQWIETPSLDATSALMKQTA